MGETTKAKRRPTELTLKEPTKVEAALRIVSPGLPKLNVGMQTTMNESLEIERQQRQLIAARNSLDPEVKTQEAPLDEPKVVVISTSQPEGDSDDSSRLSTPSTTKRLKRDNPPPPLTLGDKEKAKAMRPLVQSAPLQPFYMGPHAKSAKPHAVPYSHLQFRRLHVSPPRRYMRPLQAHPMSYAPLYSLYLRAAPYTSVAGAFPRGQRISSGPLPTSQSPFLAQVTDVYHGDFTRVAPFSSQPLSAQRDAFDKEELASGDRTLATEEEMLEMKRKHELASNRDPASEPDDSDDPERNAIDPEDNAQEEKPSGSLIIFGSINLMNESVFNFKIYPSSKDRQSTSPVPTTDDKPSNQLPRSHEESSATPATSANSDLQKQKDKFLKICETSWDEYVGAMAPRG